MELYEKNNIEWFGLPARKLDFAFDIYFIPLFGHTQGHCGVAFMENDHWIFYVGDAYYLRAELTDANHPVNVLAGIRAFDNETRKKTLASLRMVIKEHGEEINHFCYHDPSEFL
jgi:hypothetical protein